MDQRVVTQVATLLMFNSKLFLPQSPSPGHVTRLQNWQNLFRHLRVNLIKKSLSFKNMKIVLFFGELILGVLIQSLDLRIF